MIAGRAPYEELRAVGVCVATALVALLCAGLIGAVALVPAPAAVVPPIVLACVCVPMLAAWQAAPAVALLTAGRRVRRELIGELRRELDALPETPHPLDR